MWHSFGVSHNPAVRVRLGDRGRLVLPAEVRKEMNLRAGDELVITQDQEGSIRLTTVRQVVREMRGIYRSKAPNRSLAKELIAERRKEARRDANTR